MKNLIRNVAMIMVVVLMFSLCACKKLTGDMSSNSSEVQLTIEYIGGQLENISSNESGTSDNDVSKDDSASNKDNSVVNSTVSQDETETDDTDDQDISDSSVEETSSEEATSSNTSSTTQKPQETFDFKVTICTAVRSGVYAVGGVCPVDTEYILVSGSNVTETKIIPAKGKTNSYFIGEVKFSDTTMFEIQCKQSGKELSSKMSKYVFYNKNQQNLQTISDYRPFFGSNSQMHYYSALLSYSLSNIVTGDMREFANYNIGETVNYAKNVGAEVIYLVVPSSAAVYPETVPSEYTAASGESIYKAFNSIATQKGAKVIYPLNTMKSHKNDGDGYKIYSNTDSHWTTYGAYWGVYELMNHISSKYPSAKPRTVSEMGFYTTELYGGDALFSFDDNYGFENYSDVSKNGAKTVLTEIKEFTTLYNLKMPTDTLSKITRNKTSIYLTKDNEQAKRETNPNATGLPTALVVRDSFGRTAYDMINDRFSTVDWLAEGDYTSVLGAIEDKKPNYVIYVVSERNLVKVMLNNKDVPLKSFE